MDHADPIQRTDVICPGARCRRAGRELPKGARLCPACERGLATDLARLPALHDECGRLLIGSSGRSPVGRTSGGPLPGLPFNTAAADVRRAILSVLGSWCGLVAQERHIAPPRRTVTDLTRFLTRHLAWLAGHETAPQATHEIARLVGAARGITDPDGRRRVRLGVCVETDCTGELTALVHPQGTRPPGEITCSSETTHRWPAQEWTRLGWRLDRRPVDEAAHWLTATEVSRLWNVPAGSVYRLASEHRWRRRSRSGRVHYDAADVERTLTRRAARGS